MSLCGSLAKYGVDCLALKPFCEIYRNRSGELDVNDGVLSTFKDYSINGNGNNDTNVMEHM